MIPKLRVVFSFPLVHKLVKEEFSIKENLNKFRKILEDYEEKILNTISELIGCEWEEKDINIYAIPFNAPTPSISLPLILKIREDPYLNLYFLIHELVHRFFYFSTKIEPLKKKFYPRDNRLKCEAVTDFITRKVAEKIFGKEKALELRKKEQKIVTSRDLEKCEELVKSYENRYDLNKKSLIEYWKTDSIN